MQNMSLPNLRDTNSWVYVSGEDMAERRSYPQAHSPSRKSSSHSISADSSPVSLTFSRQCLLSLSIYFITLRRDVIAHCIKGVLKQPVQSYQTTAMDLMTPLEPLPSLERRQSTTEDLIMRLYNLCDGLGVLRCPSFPRRPAPRASRPLCLSARASRE